MKHAALYAFREIRAGEELTCLDARQAQLQVLVQDLLRRKMIARGGVGRGGTMQQEELMGSLVGQLTSAPSGSSVLSAEAREYVTTYHGLARAAPACSPPLSPSSSLSLSPGQGVRRSIRVTKVLPQRIHHRLCFSVACDLLVRSR